MCDISLKCNGDFKHHYFPHCTLYSQAWLLKKHGIKMTMNFFANFAMWVHNGGDFNIPRRLRGPDGTEKPWDGTFPNDDEEDEEDGASHNDWGGGEGAALGEGDGHGSVG